MSDNIGSATVISGASGSISGNNTGYTLEANEGNLLYSGTSPLGFGGGCSAWYSFTPPSNGTLLLTTSSSGGSPIGDTVLSVIDGNNFLTANILAQNDDSGLGTYSTVSVSVTSGSTIYIAVDGYSGDTGPWPSGDVAQGAFTLSWAFGIAPCPNVIWNWNALAYPNGSLSVASNNVVVGDWYSLDSFQGSQGVAQHKATATNDAWVVTNESFFPSDSWRRYSSFLTHGNTSSVTFMTDWIVGCTITTVGVPGEATYPWISWSYDGSTGLSVTFMAVGGVTYDLTAYPFPIFSYAGPFGPFPDGSTQTVNLTLGSVPGGPFALVLGDVNSNLEFANRVFTGGVSGSGCLGSPQGPPPPPPPIITNVVPDHGCVGTSVVISGSNFTGTSDVDFNGTVAAYSVDSDSQITTSVPIGATTGDLTIINSGGASTFAFTVDVNPIDNYPQYVFSLINPCFECQYYYLNYDSFRSGGCVTATTACASAQAGEPNPAPGMPASHSVWLTWDSLFTGQVTAWLESTDPNMADGVMSVYDWFFGAVSGLGAPLDQGDNELGSQPQVVFPVTFGNRYVFQIDTRNSGGEFTFHWKRSDGTPPANDNFANAQVLTGMGGETTGTFATATAECNERDRYQQIDLTPSSHGPFNTIWYKWTPHVNGTGIIMLCDFKGTISAWNQFGEGSPYIEVYKGNTLQTLIPIKYVAWPGSSNGANVAIAFPIDGTSTYHIRLDSQENLTNTTFTLIWETDALDWRVKVGTFTAGDTTITTGLGAKPSAIMIWSGCAADGFIRDGNQWGNGATDGIYQWAVGIQYPRYANGAGPANATDFGERSFSNSHIIYVPDGIGGTYASASFGSWDSQGNVELNWDVVPGNLDMFGYFAISGVEAKAGSFSYTKGDTHTDTLIPGFRVRAMLGAYSGQTPEQSVPGGTARALEHATLAMQETNHLGDYSDRAGFSEGVFWYGALNDDGDFILGPGGILDPGAPGVTLQCGDDQWQFFVGEIKFTVKHANKNMDVDFGWLALGGYGWHSEPPNQFNDLFETNFWVNGGVIFSAYGATDGEGAFDRTNSQFVINQWARAESDNHSTHADTQHSSYSALSGKSQSDFDTTVGDIKVQLPSDPAALGGNIIRTGSSPGWSFIALGNFYPQIETGFVAPVSFWLKSH